MYRSAGRLLAVLVLASCPASAEDSETATEDKPPKAVAEFLACAEEFNDTARLQCYDTAVEKLEATAPVLAAKTEEQTGEQATIPPRLKPSRSFRSS